MDPNAILWTVLSGFLSVAVAVSVLIRPYLKRQRELASFETNTRNQLSRLDEKRSDLTDRVKQLEDEKHGDHQRLEDKLDKGFATMGASVSKVHDRIDEVHNDLNTRLAHMEGATALADLVRDHLSKGH